MAGEVQHKIQDYAGQVSVFTLPLPTLTAGNFDDTFTDVGSLRAAIDALTLGNINTERVLAAANEVTPGAASDVNARRELKWLITFQDDVTGEEYLRELPAPDMTANVISGTDFADITSTDWVAFKAAVESGKTKSPDGNNWTVTAAKVVGRNI